VLRKVFILAVVILGLGTFFLPLVRVQAPMVGTQRISGWDAVKPGEKKSARDDLGLARALEQMQADMLRRHRQQTPLAVQQAQALRVTLPLAYLSLLLAGVLALLRQRRLWQITAGVGVLAGAWSLLSVFWLNSGVKQMVEGGGSDRSLLGLVRRRVAGNVEVSPEIGLYLLAAFLLVLLAASFLPAFQRKSL
jgi:FAD/FMN-containing dehydrogenase